MAEAIAAISSILSLAGKLLPVVDELAEFLCSSSSDRPNKAAEIKEDLMQLMRMLERIKATMHDAEGRKFTEKSVKLWLKELGFVACAAEDVLDDYYYQVLWRQAETRDAVNSRKRKRTQILGLDGNQIKHIIHEMAELMGDMGVLMIRQIDPIIIHMNGLRQIDPISHTVVEQKIFGREKEKEDLINFLLSECHSGGIVSVAAVVGSGGIGKTSLVQLAYDDQRIRQKFNEVMWLCASEDFSVERLTREALKSITNQHYDLNNLSALQERFCKEIRGKRLLLVLDDVWNEESMVWDLFCTPLTSAKLVKIVITTRSKSVASVMTTELTLDLVCLSEDACWKLFQHYAFHGINQNNKLKLVDIGRQIMKKCGTSPLGSKLVASMLRHEAKEERWMQILESVLWEIDNTSDPWDIDNTMIPALMLSFLHLPAYLKPCLLYSSMFPKDYEHIVENLCQLWAAQGYIKSRKGKSIETAQGYIKQLWQRSFFDCQIKGSDFKNSKLKLHGLIHDLAMFISRTYFSISSQRGTHLYVMNKKQLVDTDSYHSLRTLTVGDNVENFLTASDVPKLQSLRVLELKSQCCDSEFLSSIGNFKHLRYLSLGSFSFQRLPESIGVLYYLQNLALTKCSDIEELPDGIKNLVNLQVLSLSCCLRFQRLPECIGNFRNLEKLVLDKCDIRELPAGICQLYALQELLITGCRNLKDLPEDIGRLSALETLVIKATGVRYLPLSLNNVKGLKKLILSFKKREQ